jgi:outer membrane murein-binding lipoprotein Lpp
MTVFKIRDMKAEIERLYEEIERLRASLQIVREENDRAKRQFTNVSNKILDEACRILGSK